MSHPERLCATIPTEYSGLRADQALARLFPEHSRTRIAHWIRSGAASVDGVALSPRSRVVGGEKVDIACEGARDDTLVARDGALAIVHEDSEVLVIDKPPDLVVHPGAGNRDHTLLNRLIFFDPGLRDIPRCGIVHRLDKDTSGLMVIARTLTAHTRLVEMLRRRDVERIYEAITVGIPPSAGTIDAAIARDRKRRTRMAIDPAGKSAITHYRRLERYLRCARMEIRLETGRTHQIRVHLAHIGYPI
ncbi:RluA family pseudouridine synthase, partial [Thioalkalivibrio sp. HK1]|uniref:RluA family pseudouridine synthase n=1 Tax=Thioalkalivibrio sp. HK1 TaxID=1469245 RepID=UPI0004716BEE